MIIQRKEGDRCNSSWPRTLHPRPRIEGHLQNRPRKSNRRQKVQWWTQKKESDKPPKLHYSTTCTSHSTKQIIEQEQVQTARWAAACRWYGASSDFVGCSQKQETPLGSQELSPLERAASVENNILEMLWCLTHFIQQLFLSYICLFTSM